MADYLASTTDPRGYKENPVPLSDLAAALDELIMQDAPPMLADGDITIQRLVRHAKVSGGKAKRMLEDWTKAGKVEHIGKRREPQGHTVEAWRIKP